MARRRKSSAAEATVGLVGLFVLIIVALGSFITGEIKKADQRAVLRNKNIDEMTGEEFEIYLESVYKDLDYSVKRTPLSGDQGADLIVEKFGIKTVIQIKRWKNKVSNKGIQEIFTAKHYYNANEAIIITNSEYTKSAQELAKKIGVILYNRDDLIRLIKKSREYQQEKSDIQAGLTNSNSVIDKESNVKFPYNIQLDSSDLIKILVIIFLAIPFLCIISSIIMASLEVKNSNIPISKIKSMPKIHRSKTLNKEENQIVDDTSNSLTELTNTAKMYYATTITENGSINVRSATIIANDNIIAKLKSGEKVQVLEMTDNGWYLIKKDSVEGYIYGALLTNNSFPNSYSIAIINIDSLFVFDRNNTKIRTIRKNDRFILSYKDDDGNENGDFYYVTSENGNLIAVNKKYLDILNKRSIPYIGLNQKLGLEYMTTINYEALSSEDIPKFVGYPVTYFIVFNDNDNNSVNKLAVIKYEKDCRYTYTYGWGYRSPSISLKIKGMDVYKTLYYGESTDIIENKDFNPSQSYINSYTSLCNKDFDRLKNLMLNND